MDQQLQPLPLEKRLTYIQPIIMPVNETLVTALPKVIEAAWRKANRASGSVKWRLHTQFQSLRVLPWLIAVIPDGG